MTLSRCGRLLRRAGLVGLVVAAAGVANLAVAWAQDTFDPGEPPLDADLVARGEELFNNNCSFCHGAQGQGLQVEGPAGGPSLVDVGPASTDFMLRTGRMPAENDDGETNRGPPAFDDTERAALVAYVATFGEPGVGPEIPDIAGWQEADLARGLEQFTTNCAACHGPTAAGIAVGQNDVSSNLAVASPIVIAEAVRIGPGVMPVFSKDVVSQADLEATIRWVVSLRDRGSPGGVSIGRSGPVSEGFLAWLVGIGGLSIVMYVLGDKAGRDRAEPDDA